MKQKICSLLFLIIAVGCGIEHTNNQKGNKKSAEELNEKNPPAVANGEDLKV